jgi:hypothetical protein
VAEGEQAEAAPEAQIVAPDPERQRHDNLCNEGDFGFHDLDPLLHSDLKSFSFYPLVLSEK